jgi:hypothetical protein
MVTRLVSVELASVRVNANTLNGDTSERKSCLLVRGLLLGISKKPLTVTFACGLVNNEHAI